MLPISQSMMLSDTADDERTLNIDMLDIMWRRMLVLLVGQSRNAPFAETHDFVARKHPRNVTDLH